MSAFLLEYFYLDEARRDPNLKGMGNLNSLDPGLKRLLLAQVDRYYKFDYNDPKRTTLQAGFGTGSQLKALPGITAATTPYKMLDVFKDTKDIQALIIEIGDHQVGLVFKQTDKKTHITTFGIGISAKVKELATKDVAEADVLKLADMHKKKAKKYLDDQKANKYIDDDAHVRQSGELETPKAHMGRLQSARAELENQALEKLTKASFKTGRNEITSWTLSKGGAHGLAKQRTSEWITLLISFVRAELGQPDAEIKYIGITADPEREKLHKEREATRKGMVPRDEKDLYIKKALRVGKFDAIEKAASNAPGAYRAYADGLKKSLQVRANELRTKKANEEAMTIESAADLHKLISSGKFHEKFKLIVDGKTFVYNFYDDRNLRYSNLVKAQKDPRYYGSEVPYIIFNIASEADGNYELYKAFKNKTREVEADVEAGKLTKEEGDLRIAAAESEIVSKRPPEKIYFFMKLDGFNLIVNEVGLSPSGSWSDSRHQLVMFRVIYGENGKIEGLKPMAKSEL